MKITACNEVISRQSVMSIIFLAARKYFNLKMQLVSDGRVARETK